MDEQPAGPPIFQQAGGALVHPLPLAAVLLLALNDHVFKHTHPSFVTGKLSDVAGLFFFPLLLDAMIEVALAVRGRYRGPSMRRLAVLVALTALSFAFMKTTDLGVRVYGLGLGAIRWPFVALAALVGSRPLPALEPAGLIRDPSDLLALLVLPATIAFGRRRARAPG